MARKQLLDRRPQASGAGDEDRRRFALSQDGDILGMDRSMLVDQRPIQVETDDR